MKVFLSVLLLALVPLVAGYYITLPKHGSCGGFQESVYYMDTEDNQNANDWVGTVPDGIYSYDIVQEFCSGNVDAVPSGSYCFLLNARYPITGCPPGFTNGSRTEEEESFLNFSFFVGPHDAHPKLTYNPWWRKERPTWHFCCGTGNPETPVSFDSIATQLPPKFMLYQKGGSCQVINGRNISSGYVHFDDEDYSNSNSFAGTLPDGVFDKNTRYQFCAYDVATLPSPVPSVELNTQSATTALISWAPVLQATTYRLSLFQDTTLVQSVSGVTTTSHEFTSLNPAVQYTLKVYSGTVVNGVESYEMTGKLLQFTTCAAGSTGIPCTAFCSPDCVHGNCSTTSTCNCEPGWTGAACDVCSAEYYPQDDDCILCSNCAGHGTCSDGATGTGLCSCSAGYTGASCTDCQSEYFSSGSDCLACDPTCLTCSNATTCLSCKTGILQHGLCLSSCENGTYLEQDSCANCDPSCLTCFGGNSSQCLSCSSSLVRSGSSCLQTCPDGSYADSSNVCTPCPLNCATCSNAAECGSCQAPYVLQGTSCITPAVCTAGGGFASTGTCQPCDGSCYTCSGSGPSACTACPANTFWMEGQCLSSCPVGRFGDVVTQTCLPCVSPCVSCTSSTSCEVCAAPYFLYQSECLASCPSTTFPNTSGSSCVDCDSSCQTCADSASFCTSCASSSQSIDDGDCVDECPTGKFSDSLMQCQPCYSTCASCTSASQGDCLSCLPSTYEEGTGFCVTACSADKAPDANRVCQPVFCPETTTPAGVYYPSTQITHTALGSCPAGSVGQISSECVLVDGVGVWATAVGSCDPCPAGYYQDQAGQLMCKSCPANSNSPAGSDSSTDCACLPGYRWEAGGCIAITCPPITYQNATFLQSLGGTAVLGTCVQGYLGNPTMQCLSTGSWDLVVQSPCIVDTTPACRNPASCLSTSTALCNACYRSGGFVDPHNPTTCTCPATRTVYLPSSGYTCSPAISLCNGTYVCNEACLTCAGPASNQCYTCSNSGMVLVPSGNNPFGRCALPCLANQYRNSNGTCVSFDCSSLSNCNSLGTCYWNGQQPACQCNTGFGGSTCSIPSSCPALSNCTGHGTCTLNGATGSVYCVCSLGWTGSNCTNQTVFSFTPKVDTELGGKLITIVSSTGFSSTDSIVCTWKKSNTTGYPTNVVGYATTTAAFCVVPPNFYFFGYTTFSITINGVYFYLGQFEFQTSNGLPQAPSEFPKFKYVSGQPKAYNYSTTPVFTQGDSTVSVKIYRWDWDPFLDPEAFPMDPILMDLGVIYTGPNTGAMNITVTLENNQFNWTRSLHILSVSSGKQTVRSYIFPFPAVGDTYADRCAEWPQIFLGGVPEFLSCPIHLNSLINFDHCLLYFATPNTVFASYCYSHRFYEDNCFYDISTYYNKFQLWEPYKPTDFKSWLPQYFVSTQLPKMFCCPVSGLDCPNYNDYRVPENFGKKKKKRSMPVANPYLLAMAYGDPHFVNLNGDHFTFNGLGEFVALERAGEFEVQLRTTKRATGNATYISAVAVRLEDSYLGVYVNQMTGDFALVYNGEFQTEPMTVGSRSLVPGGKIVVRRTDEGLVVLTENKYSLDIFMLEKALSIQFVISSDLSGFTGLLGSTFEFRDGTPLPANATSMDLHPMGLSWRATAETSMFIYPPDKTFADYNVPDFVPAFPETLPEDPVFSMTAREICQAAGPAFEQDCYFDILQSQSYGSSTASLNMGQFQVKFDTAYNQPPEFDTVPSLSVVLSQQVVVSYSVSDPEDDPFSVFVSASPTSGMLDVDHQRYTFTVSTEMFLASSLTPLEFTAIDDKEAVSTHSIPVSVRRSTCAEGVDKVATESNLDLGHRCPSTSKVCSASCKSLVTSLSSLSCFPELEPKISKLYNPAKELCAEGEGNPDNSTLTPGAIAGIAVGLLVALGVIVAAVVGYVIYKKKGAQPPKNGGYEMRDDSSDFVVRMYSDPKY